MAGPKVSIIKRFHCTEYVRIEQQITKCKEENKACAMMESPAEGQQQVVRLQV